jgi:hypothetical protein
MIAGVMQQAGGSRCDVAAATCWDFQVSAQGGCRDFEAQMVGQYLSWLQDALVRGFGEAAGCEHLLDQIPSRQSFGARWQGTAGVVDAGKRVFITNVKGTFFGMSESEEASKRR